MRFSIHRDLHGRKAKQQLEILCISGPQAPDFLEMIERSDFEALAAEAGKFGIKRLPSEADCMSILVRYSMMILGRAARV